MWLAVLICFSPPLRAQIDELRIGVDGLTCSQCTRSVEVKLRQLPFIADVSMDLANTSGVLHLKPNVRFRPADVPKAVKDAGFTIRYLQIVTREAGFTVSGSNCVAIAGLNIQVDDFKAPDAGAPLILELSGAPYNGKRASRQVPKTACGPGGLRAVIKPD